LKITLLSQDFCSPNFPLRFLLGIVVLHDVCTVRVPAIVTGRIPWNDSSKLGEAKMDMLHHGKPQNQGFVVHLFWFVLFKLWVEWFELTCSVFEGLFAFILGAGILLRYMMWFPKLLAQFHALSVKLCWIVLSHARNQIPFPTVFLPSRKSEQKWTGETGKGRHHWWSLRVMAMCPLIFLILIFDVWVLLTADAATPDTFFILFWPDLHKESQSYSNLIEYLKSHRVSHLLANVWEGLMLGGLLARKHETPRRAVVFLLTMKADPTASADSWRIWRGRKTFNDFGASNLCCHKILGPLMAKTRDEVWWIPSGDRKHTCAKHVRWILSTLHPCIWMKSTIREFENSMCSDFINIGARSCYNLFFSCCWRSLVSPTKNSSDERHSNTGWTPNHQRCPLRILKVGHLCTRSRGWILFFYPWNHEVFA